MTLLALLGLPSGAVAQDTQWNRYTLEDLGGVYVRVEADEGCQAAGVTPMTYEADVSLKLIEAEVGVLTREEMLGNQALPELRVSLSCTSGSNGSSGTLAYSVGLRVQQAAQMLRDSQITLSEAVTWYQIRLGVTDHADAAESVGATLMETVDAFAAAWAAAHADEGSD